MESTKITENVDALCRAVEEAMGEPVTGPKSFERLRTFLYRRTGQYIGMTTLKRIWKYIEAPYNARIDTLSILAKAVGYIDYMDFLKANEHKSTKTRISSSPKFGRTIDVLKDLTEGNEIQLYWHPGRECLVKYLGNMKFEVLSSKNTRIKPGDTFFCHLIPAGHPLYLSSLTRKNCEPVAYICGKMHGGIQFEIIK